MNRKTRESMVLMRMSFFLPTEVGFQPTMIGIEWDFIQHWNHQQKGLPWVEHLDLQKSWIAYESPPHKKKKQIPYWFFK